MGKVDLSDAGRSYFLAAAAVALCGAASFFLTCVSIDPSLIYEFNTLALGVFYLIPSAVLIKNRSGLSKRLESPEARVSLLSAFAAVLLAFMLTHLSGIVNRALSALGLTPAVGYIPDTSNLSRFIIFVFYAVFMTGVCEELVMRGVILAALESGGSWRAILVSAGLFAILHGRVENVLQSFIAGVVLGYVTVASGSVASSVVTHISYNACVILMSFIPSEWALALFDGGVWQDAVCVILLSVMIMAVLFAIRRVSRERFIKSGTLDISVDAIILFASGSVTMVCIMALNVVWGLTGR